MCVLLLLLLLQVPQEVLDLEAQGHGGARREHWFQYLQDLLVKCGFAKDSRCGKTNVF